MRFLRFWPNAFHFDRPKNKAPANMAGANRFAFGLKLLLGGFAGHGANVSAGNTQVGEAAVSQAGKFGYC